MNSKRVVIVVGGIATASLAIGAEIVETIDQSRDR